MPGMRYTREQYLGNRASRLPKPYASCMHAGEHGEPAMNTPGLIEHQKIATIVDNVAIARGDIASAFVLLAGAKKRLSAVLGDGLRSYNSIFERDISDNNFADRALDSDRL